MKVNVISSGPKFYDDIEKDNLFYFGLVQLIECVMNPSLGTKNLNLKVHHVRL